MKKNWYIKSRLTLSGPGHRHPDFCCVLLSRRFQIAIFDLSGRLIFDRGKYIVNETWEHPGIGRCDDLPKNIKESDWAHWCENHFSITVYLK